jgi:hypothetical protein
VPGLNGGAEQLQGIGVGRSNLDRFISVQLYPPARLSSVGDLHQHWPLTVTGKTTAATSTTTTTGGHAQGFFLSSPGL